jgi:hypothetical protein
MNVLGLVHCVVGSCAKAAEIGFLMAAVGVGHNRHFLVRATAFRRLVQAMSGPGAAAELRRMLSQLAALFTDAASASASANAMFVLEYIVGRHLTFAG